jgi:hypothetical protein
LVALLLTRRSRPVTVALVAVWVFLNGTGELFLGRAGFVWAAQAGIPLVAFPILLGAAAWIRPQRTTPRPVGEASALEA